MRPFCLRPIIWRTKVGRESAAVVEVELEPVADAARDVVFQVKPDPALVQAAQALPPERHPLDAAALALVVEGQAQQEDAVVVQGLVF